MAAVIAPLSRITSLMFSDQKRLPIYLLISSKSVYLLTSYGDSIYKAGVFTALTSVGDLQLSITIFLAYSVRKKNFQTE